MKQITKTTRVDPWIVVPLTPSQHYSWLDTDHEEVFERLVDEIRHASAISIRFAIYHLTHTNKKNAPFGAVVCAFFFIFLPFLLPFPKIPLPPTPAPFWVFPKWFSK